MERGTDPSGPSLRNKPYGNKQSRHSLEMGAVGTEEDPSTSGGDHFPAQKWWKAPRH